MFWNVDLVQRHSTTLTTTTTITTQATAATVESIDHFLPIGTLEHTGKSQNVQHTQQ